MSKYRYRPELEETEIKDGEGIRTRLDFADAAVRRYLRDTAVDAAVAPAHARVPA